MEKWKVWFYAIFTMAVVYVVFKERQALGCPDVPNGSDCDNANGKAVKNTKPNVTDTTPQIFEKINKAADFGNRWVVWRLAFLLAIPCVVATTFFVYHRPPEIKELTIGVFVISSTVYAVLNFYKFHMIDHVQKHIEESVEILESRL